MPLSLSLSSDQARSNAVRGSTVLQLPFPQTELSHAQLNSNFQNCSSPKHQATSEPFDDFPLLTGLSVEAALQTQLSTSKDPPPPPLQAPANYGDIPRRLVPGSNQTYISIYDLPEAENLCERHVLFEEAAPAMATSPAQTSASHPHLEVVVVSRNAYTVKSFEIDFRGLTYVEAVNENLICSICHSPFIKPLQTPCGHIFCKECLDKALEYSQTCPIDRRPFPKRPEDMDESDVEADEAIEADILARTEGIDAIKPAPTIIRNMVDDLLVRCVNEGCDESVPRASLKSHVAEKCPHTLCYCKDVMCNGEVKRKHALEACLHVITNCEHCQVETSKIDLEVSFVFYNLAISSVSFGANFSTGTLQEMPSAISGVSWLH